MRDLLRFLIKFHFPILFLILEMVCLVLMVNNTNYQRAKFLNSSNRLTGEVYLSFHNAGQYFSLRKANEELARDNAALRARIFSGLPSEEFVDSLINSTKDSLLSYRLIAVRVINNSVNKGFNYLTLDKGSSDGIKPDMGIICGNGVVGIVIDVSENFSTALSLLNPMTRISARLKHSKYYGTVLWQDRDYQRADLTEIPFHVELQIGDSVATSGYSVIFPENILIGTISSFSKGEGKNFYQIKLDLAADFKNLYNVYVIENRSAEERIKLEEETVNE